MICPKGVLACVQDDCNEDVRNNIFSTIEETLAEQNRGPRFFKGANERGKKQLQDGKEKLHARHFSHDPDHADKGRNPLYAGVVI